MARAIAVRVFRDEAAGVWVAQSDRVPGLVTEAETVAQLAAKLERLVPELLELNAPKFSGGPTMRPPDNTH